jgi:hypothetical protein
MLESVVNESGYASSLVTCLFQKFFAPILSFISVQNASFAHIAEIMKKLKDQDAFKTGQFFRNQIRIIADEDVSRANEAENMRLFRFTGYETAHERKYSEENQARGGRQIDKDVIVF